MRVNPLHAWHFSSSLNRAKTDRLDAAMLSRFGAERQLEPDPDTDPAREELRELVQRRDQLKRMQVQEKNRLSACTLSLVAKDIRAELANLARRLGAIEKAIAGHLERHPALAAAERLLRSIPGVGAATAVTLLAHLAELGLVDRRAIASLGGLAPRAHESGKYRGRRFLGEGRRHVRRALYMAALSAMRHPGFLADVVAKMKATPTDDKLFGKGSIRADGRKVHDMYLLEVKKPEESKAPWDYYKVRATIPAAEAFRPIDQGDCPLVKK